MAISMTEAAARHVRRSLDGRGKGEGIRLGVRTTGCSGLAYVLEFVDEVVDEDQVFESHGEKVIIDPKSLTYLDGTELDFVKEGLNEGFKFNNPNVRGECGGGESVASGGYLWALLVISLYSSCSRAFGLTVSSLPRATENWRVACTRTASLTLPSVSSAWRWSNRPASTKPIRRSKAPRNARATCSR